MSVLFFDHDSQFTRYFSRFWTVFSCRDGVFSPIERARRQFPNDDFFYFHKNKEYEILAAEMIGAIPFQSTSLDEVAQSHIERQGKKLLYHFDHVVESTDFTPNKILGNLSNQISEDIKMLVAESNYLSFDKMQDGVSIIGDSSKLVLHKDAKVFPGTIFDVRNGPIVIGPGSEIGQFSFLCGPVSVGSNTHVDNCRIIGPASIGNNCRVGGEIESCIFGDYSNKHHEGFLGHSFVGRWVNIGALATTSDLKNNYGEVRLTLPSQFLSATSCTGVESVSTETIKFGSIISDCAKVAIGMKLNTGTVIDAGCNVFGNSVPKYVYPFSWGDDGDVYELNRFHEDCQKIFIRRKQHVTSAFHKITKYVWTNVHK